MNSIIALGRSEFLLGFRLVGIVTFEAHAPQEDFEKWLAVPDVGIIITDEETMSQLPPFFRETVEGKVKPITLVVSSDATSNEALRKKIKKSIGVDLWSQ